jgi:hypothetical protein
MTELSVLATKLMKEKIGDISNLDTNTQQKVFGKYIGKNKDEAIFITDSKTGKRVGYYLKGVCRYYNLMAFDDSEEVSIFYFSD